MKILLVQNSLYYPAFGGGNKSNRLLLEALAERGHSCRVITRVSEDFDPAKQSAFLQALAHRGIEGEISEGVVRFQLNCVDVHTETHVLKMKEYLLRQIAEFHPTWVIVSSDDPAQIFLRPALEASSGRVVYLCRTTLALPFGPDCAFPSRPLTETLRQCAGVVAVSHYVRDYIIRWSGIPAVALPISLQGKGPFPRFANYERGFVLMVNPCAVKGLPIFLELARRFPQVAVAAVPTWGTTEADKKALSALPNMTLLEPRDDIDDILRQTRVLVVPSLWAEARCRMVVEAMLRGVPVLAANVGGIGEAMMGVPYLLPVRPIERYRPQVDEQLVPVAETPLQDVGPWAKALEEVLGSRARYEEISELGRSRALAYVESLSVEPFETYLKQLSAARQAAPAVAAAAKRVETLSAEKRALLAMLARKRQAERDSGPVILRRELQRGPLAFAQERYWALAQSPNPEAAHVPMARLLSGPLHQEALVRSLQWVARRHQPLHMCFSAAGQSVIDLDAAPLRLEDVRDTSDREKRLKQIIDEETVAPFDLERGPAFRCALIRLAESEYLLLLTVHHIAADGWSFGIFQRELAAAYQAYREGLEPPLTPLPVSYLDFVVWQREQAGLGRFDEDLAFWRERLRDWPRPAQAGHRGRRVSAIIPRSTLDALHDLARENRATLFMALLAAAHRLLGPESWIASPVANRPQPDLEGLIGLFVNLIITRTPARPEMTFHELLLAMRQQVMEAFEHQTAPYELFSGAPISPPVLFVLQNAAREGLELPGVRSVPLELDTGFSEHQLRISALETAQGLITNVQYSTDHFSEAEAAALLVCWRQLLETMSRHPHRPIAWEAGAAWGQ